MELRDATEADVPPLSDLLELPARAVREMIHRRSVRIAVEDDQIRGVVAYDADADAVQVASLRGSPPVLARLLEEPIAFGEREGLPTEMVLPDARPEIATALTEAGFAPAGQGPSFQGNGTTKYRREPGGQ